MCGRFSQRTPAKQIADKFGVAEVPPLVERYNVAPMQAVLGVRAGDGVREATFFQWGLVPRWAKDPAIGNKLINARAETILEKPSFREPFKQRRCLIPAEGFYEWRKAGRGKQPFYFQLKAGHSFAFAGIWDEWQGEGGVIPSCAIITTQPNEVVRSVHDRMPVILHEADYELWLNDDPMKQESRRALLAPYPAAEMETYMVSTLVNDPHHEGAELTERATATSA